MNEKNKQFFRKMYLGEIDTFSKLKQGILKLAWEEPHTDRATSKSLSWNSNFILQYGKSILKELATDFIQPMLAPLGYIVHIPHPYRDGSWDDMQAAGDMYGDILKAQMYFAKRSILSGLSVYVSKGIYQQMQQHNPFNMKFCFLRMLGYNRFQRFIIRLFKLNVNKLKKMKSFLKIGETIDRVIARGNLP